MKKYLLLFGLIMFVGLMARAQTCGPYIDMMGEGIADETGSAVMTITDFDKYDMMTVEAIYKAPDAPESVVFKTASQEIEVDPLEIPISGDQTAGWYTSLFRVQLEPAPSVELDFGENIDEFFSMVIYLFREDGGIYTVPFGQLTHVWKNESEPLQTLIEVPVADGPRDIIFRFGITEMTDDSREAIFSFLVDGEVVEEKFTTWQGEGTRSFIMREMMFEDVPGDVDNIVMTMLSNNEGGDSFISGLVLADLPCEEYEPELLCSYTQGFYGNEGGKTCQGWTTRELLEDLLVEDLMMGGGDNTFTIPAEGVDCVLDLLPGGGPSKALTGHASCGDLGSIETNKQGRIKNTLLAQGITLSLNLRLSPGLEGFPVDGEEFTVWMAGDCSDPENMETEGEGSKYAFSDEMAEYLGEGATVLDLLDLVNEALSGEDVSPLSLSQISDAATKVNEAFDECVVVGRHSEGEEEMDGETSGGLDEEGEELEDGEEGSTKGVLGISREEAGEILEIYPNPVTDRFFLSIPARVKDIRDASIYDISGVKVFKIDQSLRSGVDQVIEVDASMLNPGIYFIRIDSGAGTVYKRFGVK